MDSNSTKFGIRFVLVGIFIVAVVACVNSEDLDLTVAAAVAATTESRPPVASLAAPTIPPTVGVASVEDAQGFTTVIVTPVPSPTPSATPLPISTGVSPPSSTPSAIQAPLPTSTFVPVATPRPTPSPTITPIPRATPSPRATATPRPTSTPSPVPTPMPTAIPTPTTVPTAIPTATPLDTESPTSESTSSELAEVSLWLYLIDVNLDSETVDKIVDSNYDMVVLDFIPSEDNNQNYPIAKVIRRLHEAPHPKIVIAYIDTGQAEDYRTYWEEDWRIGDPEWITALDPDGWEGNFPVAFWHEEWREIWLGEGGYLKAIVESGFDGVYLDWVEAYSDENVLAAAEEAGVDTIEETIRWVGDIARFTRLQKPGFIVIGQNAAELAQYDEYLEIIDAISQEQVWFDGGADNDPPGDCPLPKTDDDIDTSRYRGSLSEPCRRTYDSYPESTLHVSSEEYLHYLNLAKQKGEIIFTVDYALEPENISWVYQTSRRLGFVPFVGNRALDQYIIPVP